MIMPHCIASISTVQEMHSAAFSSYFSGGFSTALLVFFLLFSLGAAGATMIGMNREGAAL